MITFIAHRIDAEQNEKESTATYNKILYQLLTMKRMRSTSKLFVLPLGYLAVIIPEFEQNSVTPR